MKIIVDNEWYKFDRKDLPILIHGSEKSGSSFFSVCLISQLFKAGNKILFFTAFPLAKDDFRNLAENDELSDCEFVDTGDKIIGRRVIVINSGEEKNFLEIIKHIPDIKERIIFIKNIELYSENILNALDNHRLLIISGNIDECGFLPKIKEIEFKNRIFFSGSKKYLNIDLNGIGKYEAIVVNGENNKRIVKLDK